MIILVGASASGKTEAAKRLKTLYGIEKVVTTTTREPRTGEINGVDYFFVSVEEFQKRLKLNKFIEHTIYCNNYYGTGKDQIGFNKVLVVEPDGLESFNNLNDPSIITFLLEADEEIRRERMINRGDNKNDVEKRLINDSIKFNKDNICKVDFIIKTNLESVDEISKNIFSKYQAELINRKII